MKEDKGEAAQRCALMCIFQVEPSESFRKTAVATSQTDQPRLHFYHFIKIPTSPTVVTALPLISAVGSSLK